MKSQPIFCLAVILVVFAPFVLLAPTKNLVCIVGASPVGFIAANKLEIRGQQIEIFEKQVSEGSATVICILCPRFAKNPSFFTYHFSGRKLDRFRVSFQLLASLKTAYQTNRRL
jgi:hypothetical protein